jgi:hypothetical protein
MKRQEELQQLKDARKQVTKLMSKADAVYDALVERLGLGASDATRVYDYVFGNSKRTADEALGVLVKF